tara:strand:- start:10986 stop:14423 length:3438 start_codon:yes stop_codon:yes gene_type:complete
LSILINKKVKITAVIIASLLATYSLLGYLVIPWYAKKALSSYAAEKMQRELAIERIQFNPFTFRIQAENIALNEKNHDPIASLTRLDVNIDLNQVFKKTLVISTLQLNEPHLELIIDKTGSLNLSRLIDELSSDSADEDTAPAIDFLFVLTQIKQGSVLVVNHSKEHPIQSSIKDVNLEFSSISTLENEEGEYQVVLDLDRDTRVNLTGSLSLTPLMSSGQFQFADLSVTHIHKWVKDALPVEFLSGNASVSGYYKLFSSQEGDLLFDLDKTDISIKALSVKESVSQVLMSLADLNVGDISYTNTQQTAKVKSISLSGFKASTQTSEPLVELTSLSLSDFSYEIETAALRLTTVDLNKLTLAPRSNTPALVQLDRLSINDVGFNDDFSQVSIGKVELTDNQYLLETDAMGRLILPEFNIANEKTPEGNSDEEISSSDIRIELGELEIMQTSLSTFRNDQPDQHEQLLNLNNIMLVAADIDLGQSNAVVESLTLVDGTANLTLDKAGLINVLQLFATDVSIEKDNTTTTKESDTRFKLEKFTTQGFNVQVVDNSFATSLQHRVHNIDLEALDINNEVNSRVELNLNAVINNQGALSLAGWVSPVSTDAEFDIELSKIDFSYLNPYIENYANVSLISGTFGFKGNVSNSVENNGITIKNAESRLSKLQLQDRSNNTRLIAVDTLDVTGFSLSTTPLNIGVKEIKLSEPYVNVHIDEQQNLNLLKAFKPVGDDPVNSDQETQNPGAMYTLTLDRIDMDKGSMDFADLSMTPKFSVQTHGLTGNVSGLSSVPERYASMHFDGRVNEFGSLSINGELQPFDYRKLSEIDMEFKNISTNSLSPYAAKFAGRKIESGSLSLSLDYKIANNKLDGRNNIVLEKLVLGDKVISPDAMDLPLDMAISLLEDDNGKIDIKLPIKGDLNSPEFEMKTVINKAIGNLFGGIVTAPFKFIGSILGMSGDELKFVHFVPGETDITPPEAEKLMLLSEALLERPALLLVVSGAYDQELDSIALAKKSLLENINKIRNTEQALLNYSEPEVQDAIMELANQQLDKTTRLKLHELASVDETVNDAVISRVYHKSLFNELARIESAKINPGSLKVLATDRAKAIVNFIIDAEKSLVDRVKYMDKVILSKSEGNQINVTLNLDTQ